MSDASAGSELRRLRPARTVHVTGANGSLARALCARLDASGVRWKGVVRETPQGRAPIASITAVGDYVTADWRPLVDSVDCIVHVAALTERGGSGGPPSRDEYLAANREVTRSIADAAAGAGVRRIVLVSSIKACGEATLPGAPLQVDAPHAPLGDYAASKAAGETALASALAGSAVEHVVLRPTIVYGPGARGNFATLATAIRRGWPLPLRGVRNRRSLLYLGNAAAALEAAIDAPALAGHAWPLADLEVVSTEALALAIGHALGRPARLFRVPPPAFRTLARAIGRPGIATRLFESLEVDSAPLWHAVGIAPRTQREAFAETLAGHGPG